MFGKRLTLFSILGFDIKIDLSWCVLAIVLTSSLSMCLFPVYCTGLPKHWYWWMGIFATFGVFASIIFHEIAHGIVARKYGMTVTGISLFILGGMAEIEDDLPAPVAELVMSVSGPAASAALAIFFSGFYVLGNNLDWVVFSTLAGYLAMMNAMLAVFNIIPAFPLDGGRILRALIWKWKENKLYATRIASVTGSFFGLAFITFGFYNLSKSEFVSGGWWILVGWFLHYVSQASYRQLLRRNFLKREHISRFMYNDPVTVTPNMSYEKFTKDYLEKYDQSIFPVVDSGKLLGCVVSEHAKKVPKSRFAGRNIRWLISRCSLRNTVRPEMNGDAVLSKMSQLGLEQFMVADGETLLGMVAFRDMLKIELPNHPPEN